MALEYVMRPNILDHKQETFRAQIVNSESFTTEDLIDYVSRTNAGVSKPEVVSIEAAFEDAFAYFLSQGKFFRSPLLRLSLSIRGSYQKGEHPKAESIHANAVAGSLLQQAATKAELKVGQETIKWAIDRIFDVSTKQADSVLTIGKNIRIEGKGLALVGDAAVLEFISDTAPLVTVQADRLAVNTPSLLVLDVPTTLTPGPYHINIVTQYTSGSTANAPHTITYDVVLNAQNPTP
jgi:hypothetical protein